MSETTSKPKYSWLPWKPFRSTLKSQEKRLHVMGRDGFPVCEVFGDTREEQEANAKLIIKASETEKLLAKLVTAVEEDIRMAEVAVELYQVNRQDPIALRAAEEDLSDLERRYRPLLTQIQKLEGGGE